MHRGRHFPYPLAGAPVCIALAVRTCRPSHAAVLTFRPPQPPRARGDLRTYAKATKAQAAPAARNERMIPDPAWVAGAAGEYEYPCANPLADPQVKSSALKERPSLSGFMNVGAPIRVWHRPICLCLAFDPITQRMHRPLRHARRNGPAYCGTRQDDGGLELNEDFTATESFKRIHRTVTMPVSIERTKTKTGARPLASDTIPGPGQ
jgi:hypothetical protein